MILRCSVTGVDRRDAGGADPFGEGKDLCVGLIVEVEAADQGFYFLSGKVAVTSRIMVSAPPWEQLLKIHKAVRCVEDETLFVGEGIRLPTPFSFRYMCSRMPFFSSPGVLCGIR